MSTGVDRTFLFHADASPLGGVILPESPTALDTLGSSSLAQVGGHAHHDQIPTYGEYTKVLSATKAYSDVSGTKTNDGWTSEVISTVEHLNIDDGQITAAKMVAHLIVKHPVVGYSPTVLFGTSTIENLQVKGVRIDPKLDSARFERIVSPPDAAVGSWIDDPEMLGEAVKHCRLMTAAGAPAWVKEHYGWMKHKKGRKLRGHVVCSLVSAISPSDLGPSYGHVLDVPGVGRLILGELRVDQGSFGLTMLRVERECRDKASVSVATAHSNGRPDP